MWAVERGRANLATSLLEDGSDPRLATRHGITPLHMAAYIGDEGIARHLLLFEADCNAKDVCGLTALHVAVLMDHPWIADLLRAKGADEGDSCRWRTCDSPKPPSCQMRNRSELYERLCQTTSKYLDFDIIPDQPGGYSVSDLVPISQNMAAVREAQDEAIANEGWTASEVSWEDLAERTEESGEDSESESGGQEGNESGEGNLQAIQAGEGWQPSLCAVVELSGGDDVAEESSSPVREQRMVSVCDDLVEGSTPT